MNIINDDKQTQYIISNLAGQINVKTLKQGYTIKGIEYKKIINRDN